MSDADRLRPGAEDHTRAGSRGLCRLNQVVARAQGPVGLLAASVQAFRSSRTSRDCRARCSDGQRGAVHLELVSLIVHDYDEAIAFFTDKLQFDLVEDVAARTNDGRPKRWVVVRPPGASTGLLLALADGDDQRAIVGRQHAGRVGFFLRVDDFDAAHERMSANGVEFLTVPRDEPYGRLAVFRDVAGNRRTSSAGRSTSGIATRTDRSDDPGEPIRVVPPADLDAMRRGRGSSKDA